MYNARVLSDLSRKRKIKNTAAFQCYSYTTVYAGENTVYYIDPVLEEWRLKHRCVFLLRARGFWNIWNNLCLPYRSRNTNTRGTFRVFLEIKKTCARPICATFNKNTDRSDWSKLRSIQVLPSDLSRNTAVQLATVTAKFSEENKIKSVDEWSKSDDLPGIGESTKPFGWKFDRSVLVAAPSKNFLKYATDNT